MIRSATPWGLCAALCLCFDVSVAAAESPYPFDFHVPEGWHRLTGDYPDPTNIPAEASSTPDGIGVDYIREAMSGTFQFYAVDPPAKGDWRSPVGATATGAVVKDTGRITTETLEQYISGLAQNAPPGVRIKIDEARLVKLKGVDVGMFAGSVEGPAGTQSMLQYLIPGKTQSALLTFKCAPKDYDGYRPVFESAAMATTGAYDHTPRYDWRRTAVVAIVGGLFGVGRMLVIWLRQKPGAAATATPATAAARNSTTGAWGCPSCQRRVPAQVAQCRCGVTRPA